MPARSGQATPSGGGGGVKLTRSKAWLEEYNQSDDPVKILFSSVHSHHDSSGAFVAEPFLELPSKKASVHYLGYYPSDFEINWV